MSAFAEPLAQAREAATLLFHDVEELDEFVVAHAEDLAAALDLIERQATEYESALRRCKMRAIDAHNECGMAAPQDYFLQDIERIVDAALSAREEQP